MGEKQNQPFQLSFNASLKVDFQGSPVTSDDGLILIRELDERLGLEKLIEEQLSDSRQGLNKKFTLADPIAIGKSGPERGGSERCPRNRLRGSKRAHQMGKNEP